MHGKKAKSSSKIPNLIDTYFVVLVAILISKKSSSDLRLKT